MWQEVQKAWVSYYLNHWLGAKHYRLQAAVAWVVAALPFCNLSGILRFICYRKVSAFDYLSILCICYACMNVLYFNLHIRKLNYVKIVTPPEQTQSISNHSKPSQQANKSNRPIIQSVNYSLAGPKRSPKITPELEEKIKASREIERLSKINIEDAPPISENLSEFDEYLSTGGKIGQEENSEAVFEGKAYDGVLVHASEQEDAAKDISDVVEIKESATTDHLQGNKEVETSPAFVYNLLDEAKTVPFERGKVIFNKIRKEKYMG